MGLIEEGANLPALIVAACRRTRITLRDFDILVVAQKIVSKAEGRIIDLEGLRVSPRAARVAREVRKGSPLTAAILGESRRLIRMARGHLIVEHKLGMILANAGIDRSNASLRSGVVTLLPRDPDRSARRLREGVMDRAGLGELAVIIADSLGRPFRHGSVGTAIGLAGISPLRDYRGKKDLYGYVLRSSLEAVADEISSLANLLMGQGDEGMPVVIVRGLEYQRRQASARQLIRDRKKDLFR